LLSPFRVVFVCLCHYPEHIFTFYTVVGGWCERYKQQGQHCDGISKMNGHCECAPGLKCTWIPDPTLPPLILQTLPSISINVRSLRPGGHSECR